MRHASLKACPEAKFQIKGKRSGKYEGIGVRAFVRRDAVAFLDRLKGNDVMAWQAVLSEVVLPKLADKSLSEIISKLRSSKLSFCAKLFEVMLGPKRMIDEVDEPENIVSYFKRTVSGYVHDAYKYYNSDERTVRPTDEEWESVQSSVPRDCAKEDGYGRLPCVLQQVDVKADRVEKELRSELNQYLGELCRRRNPDAHRRAVVLALTAGGAKPADIAWLGEMRVEKVSNDKEIGGKDLLQQRKRREKAERFRNLCNKGARHV